MIDDLAHPEAARRVPRRAARSTATRSSHVLVGLVRAAAEADPTSCSVDVNPLIVVDGRPVAVDALVELATRDRGGRHDAPVRSPSDEQFRALFEPRGVVVAGASTHPGKFGFVALHNILSVGLRRARCSPQPRGRRRCSASQTVADDRRAARRRRSTSCSSARPRGANPDLLRAVRAPRASGPRSSPRPGYGEAGEEGRPAERELVALADELGILLAGPNGQGVVSHARVRCARRSSPRTRRPGAIGVASQSGNFVSSFLNYAGADRASASAAPCRPATPPRSRVADYLDYFADDPATAVGLAYVEGIADGRALRRAGRAPSPRASRSCSLKGGATAGGQRAAASHTGALASDDRVFDGMCRQAGVTRAATVEEAFEAAATFATQPLPHGPERRGPHHRGRLGRGHRRRDHRATATSSCSPLPDDLRAAIDDEAAAALEPQQPDRPRRRRDPRHHPRGAGAGRRAPRRRRGRVPRARHPVEPGAA